MCASIGTAGIGKSEADVMDSDPAWHRGPLPTPGPHLRTQTVAGVRPDKRPDKRIVSPRLLVFWSVRLRARIWCLAQGNSPQQRYLQPISGDGKYGNRSFGLGSGIVQAWAERAIGTGDP